MHSCVNSSELMFYLRSQVLAEQLDNLGLHTWAHIALGLANLGVGFYQNALAEAITSLALNSQAQQESKRENVGQTAGTGATATVTARPSTPCAQSDVKVEIWSHRIISGAHSGLGEFALGLVHAEQSLRLAKSATGNSILALRAVGWAYFSMLHALLGLAW